jgi:hypothetical protein
MSFSLSLSNHPFCGDLDLHTALCCDAESAAAAVTRLFALRARSPAVARHEFFQLSHRAQRSAECGAVAFVSLLIWILCVREKPIFNAANQQSEFSDVIFHSGALRPARVSLPRCRFAAASLSLPVGTKKAEMHFLLRLPPRPQMLLAAAHCEIFVVLLFDLSLC